MRDGFVFYRSFFESFEGLSRKDKLILFEAVCNYALNDIEPELVGVPSAIFKLLKPQVDANNRRYENGKKGGRPKETKPKPNDNLTETKTEPKEKDKDKDKDKVKDKEKVNVKEQPQAPGSGGGGGSEGDGLFNIWKRMTPEDVDRVYDAFPNTGGILIDEVYAEVKRGRREVKDPVAYILGYAKKVGWDDAAEHEEVS